MHQVWVHGNESKSVTEGKIAIKDLNSIFFWNFTDLFNIYISGDDVTLVAGNQQASVSWLSDEEVAVLPRPGWTATEYRWYSMYSSIQSYSGTVVQ